jgi:hypothetical protein
MALFVSYSDESDTQNDARTFFMAGYAARETEWPRFAKSWQQRVLDGTPELPYLHMTDIRSPQWRSEHNITATEAERRTDEAIGIIESSSYLAAIVVCLNRSDLEDTVHQKLRDSSQPITRNVADPDYLSFLAYAESTIYGLRKCEPDVDRVNFVVSVKEKVTHHLKDFHAELKARIRKPFQSLVGELFPGRMDAVIPLQAADVLCWHLQRERTGNMSNLDTRRIDRLANTKSFCYRHSRADLDAFADSLVEQSGIV